MFLPKTGVLLASGLRITSKLSRLKRSLNWTLYRLKQPTGARTALAEELNVELTRQRLVVVHETVSCDYDPDMGYEFCDLEEESVERFVGANNIIEHLQATLDAYTYAHPE